MTSSPAKSPAYDIIATSQDRRREVRERHHNGLDIVEAHENRRGLTLMFLEQTPQHLVPANIRIDGPADQPAVAVIEVRRVTNSDARLRDHLLADLSTAGGEGVYRVSMVEARPDGLPGITPLRDMDPRFTSCTVRFDVDEPSSATIAAPTSTTTPPAPAASYIARDYEALRQLLLNNLVQDMPDWTEQHVPDVVVMLIELFAFLGDDLSYYQDAVSTEAYLQTARRRTSIRRHSRLVGYPFHDGCHARAWISLTVAKDCELPLKSISFTAQTPTSTLTFTPLHATLPSPYAAGETPKGPPKGTVVSLLAARDPIEIYAWGESDTYLPVGTTEATLAQPEKPVGAPLQLQPGDVVMFEELYAADGGPPDETHRHVVRLTRVEAAQDPLTARNLLEVAWDQLDALPFQLPVTTHAPHPGKPACAVVRANLVLVGHGKIVPTETLTPSTSPATSPSALAQPGLTWSCPYPNLNRVAEHQTILLKNLYHSWRNQLEMLRRHALRGTPLDEHKRAELSRQFTGEIIDELGLRGDPELPAEEQAEIDALAIWILLARADDLLETKIRRLHVLSRLAAASGPLSGPLITDVRHDWGEDVAGALDPHHPAAWGSAAEATTQDPTTAQPLLTLADATSTDGQPPSQWDVTTGLVDAEPETKRVVVEMELDGTAWLRFNPATPPSGTLEASYLIGSGSAGNVAAETITMWQGGPTAISSVRNPLPASGGTDPETLDAARRAIPGCFQQNQPRALTPSDYTAIAQTISGVRNAATLLRWSGNRLCVRVAVQPTLGEDPSTTLLHRVEHTLVVAKAIGHDLTVTPPDYHPLVIGLTVELDSNAIRDVVRDQIAELLGSGQLSDGSPAFFHPSRFSFGNPLYQSALVAAVQEASGVVSVLVTKLGFLKPTNDTRSTRSGETLKVSPTGIIRCDNDPASPENGQAELTLVGGR
jgi:predicted phage baseplate assembly protein